MAVKLITDPDTGILTIRPADEFGADEVQRFLRALYRGASNSAPPAMLWDLSGVSLVPSVDIPSITSFVRRYRPKTPGCTAVVADEDVVYGLARMGQAYLDDLPLKFHVFRSRDDAIAWLRDCRCDHQRAISADEG